MTDDTGIIITRTFAAPRELVYDAWLTPEHFASWFGGSASEIPVESVSMDVRNGGAWSATMYAGPDRFEIAWSGRYIDLDRANRIVLTLTDVAESDDLVDEKEYVTVSFTDVDGGTEMVFHQGGGHLDPEQYEQAKAGWETFFDSLAAIVEK